MSRIIKRIIVHCSDTYTSMDIGVKEIRDWHVNENKWNDIGYHFVIRRDGKIEDGRPLEIAGAHTFGYNENSIGICLVGGRSTTDEPEFNYTEQQMSAVTRLIKNLRRRFNDAEVTGHRDHASKPCPCFNVKAYFAQ